jgi:hypothetical protein
MQEGLASNVTIIQLIPSILLQSDGDFDHVQAESLDFICVQDLNGFNWESLKFSIKIAIKWWICSFYSLNLRQYPLIFGSTQEKPPHQKINHP